MLLAKKKIKFQAWVQKCHFGNFSIFPSIHIHNMSQGPPNQGFMQEKVQKGDFVKKPSRELKNCQNDTFEPMLEI